MSYAVPRASEPKSYSSIAAIGVYPTNNPSKTCGRGANLQYNLWLRPEEETGIKCPPMETESAYSPYDTEGRSLILRERPLKEGVEAMELSCVEGFTGIRCEKASGMLQNRWIDTREICDPSFVGKSMRSFLVQKSYKYELVTNFALEGKPPGWF